MRVEPIASLDDERIAEYRILRDPELVRRNARFLAEGRHLVRTLLTTSPLEACSVLATPTARAWLEHEIPAPPSDLPVYEIEPGQLKKLAGYAFHQGCLGLGVRPAPVRMADLLARSPATRLVLGLDGLSNPDNVGGIFRTAAAFHVHVAALSPDCSSPLYRKALRASMGAALELPFVHGPDWEEILADLLDADFELAAICPDGATSLEDVVSSLRGGRRLALLLGAEGAGLGAASLERAVHHVRIPMRDGVDSLNVAAAAAIALYRFRGPHA